MKVRECLLAALLGWADVSGDTCLLRATPLQPLGSAPISLGTVDTGHWTPCQHGGGSYYNTGARHLSVAVTQYWSFLACVPLRPAPAGLIVDSACARAGWSPAGHVTRDTW